MRIVFDTNVLLAAFITRGASAEVFKHCLLRHTLVISPFILQEMEDKLLHKFCFPSKEVKEVLTLLSEMTEVVPLTPLTEPVCRDATDDWILATALSAEAQVIITGDKDLLDLKKYQGIDIIMPADFWRYESSR